MSTDHIRRVIQEKASKAQEHRRQAEVLEAEARGMKEALAILMASEPRPKAYPSSVSSNVSKETKNERTTGRVGGRQPGAISNRWKRNLLDLKSRHGSLSFTVDDVVDVVERLEGRTMKPGEARRLIDGYVPHGHVDDLGDGHYRVSDEAAARFKTSLGSALDDNDNNDDDETDVETNEAADDGSSAAPISQPLDPIAGDRQADPSEPGRGVEHDNIS